jgi:TolB-like protein
MDSSGKSVVVAILAFGAVLATIAYLGKPEVRLKPQSPITSPTLAVLPFDNLGGADELELVAADTTVSVTRAIAGLQTFDVIPRARVLEYAGIPGGVEAVAEELGADYVLAGSVERDGERVRLQAYLVMPGERPRIWADEFFFQPEDAERIPQDVARAIADALGDTR